MTVPTMWPTPHRPDEAQNPPVVAVATGSSRIGVEDMHHSPTIRLQDARRRLELAREECPHWDMEDDNDDTHACCHEVREAKREFHKAKSAVQTKEKA